MYNDYNNNNNNNKKNLQKYCDEWCENYKKRIFNFISGSTRPPRL